MAEEVRDSPEAGRRLGYVPALDGIRGVGILMVLWHHGLAILDVGHFEWVLGGWIGVDMFFVLSGFLITTLLLERRTESGLGLRGFYWRRAKRLLPALVMFLAAHAAVVLVTGRSLGTELRTVFAALTYTTNYAATFGWDLAGDQVHLWSLAVEEQFYLLWPLALLLLLRRPRRTALWVVGAVIVAVGLWRAHLAARYGGGLPVVYPRFDARMDALLIGCSLAMALHWGWRPSRRFSTATGVVGTAVIGGLFLTTDPGADFLYNGGFTVAALASAGLVLALREGGPLTRVFGWRPFVSLGVVSYSLYLWHGLAFTAAAALLPDARLARFAVALLLAVGAAAASYRYIERPILTGAPAPALSIPRPLMDRPAPRPPRAPRRVAAVASATAGVLLVGSIGAGAAIDSAEERWQAEAAEAAAAAGAGGMAPAEEHAPAPTVPPATTADPPATASPPSGEPGTTPPVPTTVPPPANDLLATELVVAPPEIGAIELGAPLAVTFTANLTTADGRSLAGRTITFTLRGVDASGCDGQTDRGGAASCTVTLELAPGDPLLDRLGVSASYAGDTETLASTGRWPVVAG